MTASCGTQPENQLDYTLKDDGTYEVSGIGTCTDLDVVIPSEYKGISITSIGNSAFLNCANLTSIIPDSVASIGKTAFYDCDSLISINYTGSVERWSAISKGSYNSALALATIHYHFAPEQ